MKSHQLSADQVAKEIKTSSAAGLSEQEAQERLKKHGPNKLKEVPPPSWLWVFITQFQNPLIYVLLIAATIIFFVGPEKKDAFIISGVLLFNAIIGTIQEGRTRNIIEALKRYIKTTSIVIRGGKKLLLDDVDLVVGDLIVLQEGSRIPADARIIESNNLQVNEAVLTGESEPVRKTTEIIAGDVVIGDQKNVVFQGTYVLSGSGKALVTAIGAQTEIGKIHTSIEEVETAMPLRQELERLSYVILLFIFALCVLLFGIGLFNGKPIKELLVMLTALFICVVPEGLPVVFTLVLVSGVYRMAKHNVLVKKMQAVEGLGRTDVVVIDKTGTLTRNEMMVSQTIANGKLWHISGEGYHEAGEITHDGKKVAIEPEGNLMRMGIASSLLNTAEISPIKNSQTFDIKGDPTEAAMFVFSKKLGISSDELEKTYKKIYEIPFDSQLRYHASFYEKNGKGVLFVAGSPELIMQRSTSVDEATQDALGNLLEEGLRMVAIATKEFSLTGMPDFKGRVEVERVFFQKVVQNGLSFLGIVGIQDAIRPEVQEIIEQTREAGLKVVMATGDHMRTALYVARKAGIFCEEEGDRAMQGVELEKMSDDEVLKQLENITVFARVSPEHKLRIVQLYHKKDKIVAMTGDGINDAPSLVAADLGIAMGSTGTEVAKQAADILLLDDSFEHIVHAIEQGRHIFYSLRRVVLYFFATNMGEILIILFALLANLPLPITAAQILWLNLVTDGFLDVALSTEQKEPGLLRQGWLKEKLRLVDSGIIFKMLFVSIPMGLGSLWVFLQYYQTDIAYARTMTLLTMAMFQWFNAWNCRSETQSIAQLGFFTNPWLIAATVFVLGLQVLLIYAPFMQLIFDTVPLSLQDWGLVFAISAPIVLFEELRKLCVRRWYTRPH